MGRSLRKETKKRIDKIYATVKRAPKKGIWLEELAKRVGISRSHLNYYLFGSKKAEDEFGGYLKNKIRIVRREGNNKFVTLQEEQT